MEKRSPGTTQFPFRMKKTLRARLEKSAKSRGVSLNAEMIRRLEESFLYGPEHISRIAQHTAETMLMVERRTGKKATDREIWPQVQMQLAGYFGLPFGQGTIEGEPAAATDMKEKEK